MSTLTLSPSSVALKTSMTYPFGANGGTPPYVYSVVAGGAGGTINSGSGLYTSPSSVNSTNFSKNTDVIKVTDSLNATATSSVMVGTPLELVCDIIQTQMGLSNDRIYLWDQKIKSPSDMGVWVFVAEVGNKCIANNNKFDPTLGQIQSVNMRMTLDINIISRDRSAVNRKEEILMALNSFYSERQQELNNFRVYPVPTGFVNLSNIDGAAIPYRFTITVNVVYNVVKTSSVDYYDDFDEVDITDEP